MLITVLILATTAALAVLWFRYTCTLILSSKPAKDYSQQVAEANRLKFPAIQQDLEAIEEPRQWDEARQLLESDYELLTFVFRYGPRFQFHANTLERRLLMIDFSLLRFWYSLTRRSGVASPRPA